MSAAEGQKLMQMTVATLASIRDDTSFDLFWQKTNSAAEDVDVEKLSLPRRRKIPRRLDDGSEPTFPDSAENTIEPSTLKRLTSLYLASRIVLTRLATKTDFEMCKTSSARNVQDLFCKKSARPAAGGTKRRRTAFCAFFLWL